MSCQSPPKPAEQVEKVPQSKSELVPRTMAVTGVSQRIADLAVKEANKHRKYKMRHSQAGADYMFRVYRVSRGYLVKLYQKERLVQTSRALSEYEIPLVVAALSRDHIRDQAKPYKATPFDW